MGTHNIPPQILVKKRLTMKSNKVWRVGNIIALS